MNEPWKCPRCERINAHWLPHCDCKPWTRTLREGLAQHRMNMAIIGGTIGAKCFRCDTDIDRCKCHMGPLLVRT